MKPRKKAAKVPYKEAIVPTSTAQTLQEAARSLPFVGNITFKQWREEFERRIEDGERREDVESWAFIGFNLRNYDEYHGRLLLLCVAPYIMDFVHPSKWQYERVRGVAEKVDRHHPFRVKMIRLLSINFFGAKEDVWTPIETFTEVFATAWRFLACEENYPSEGVGRKEGRLNNMIRSFVGRAYYFLVNQPGEPFDEMRPNVVQALVHTKQLYLALKYRDTSPSMIQALEQFAMQHGKLPDYDREPESIREVFALGYHSIRPYSEAAGIALSLRTIREEQEKVVREARRELEKLEARIDRTR